MDTIIFIVLLIGAILGAKGASSKVVIPVWLLGAIMTALLFNHHVTSQLNLSF